MPQLPIKGIIHGGSNEQDLLAITLQQRIPARERLGFMLLPSLYYVTYFRWVLAKQYSVGCARSLR
jgi:hypothetical protein